MSNFTVKAESRGHYEVIKVTGELDVYSSPWLREASIRAGERGRHHQVIDLQACSYMDATSLGVLVGALKRTRQHQGSLQVVCTSSALLSRFHLTGLEKVLTICPDLDTALQEATQ